MLHFFHTCTNFITHWSHMLHIFHTYYTLSTHVHIFHTYYTFSTHVTHFPHMYTFSTHITHFPHMLHFFHTCTHSPHMYTSRIERTIFHDFIMVKKKEVSFRLLVVPPKYFDLLETLDEHLHRN